MSIVRSKYYGIIRGATVGISFFFADRFDDFPFNVSNAVFNYCIFYS